MSDFVKCNHCGHYPARNGYYCEKCGQLVNNYFSGSPGSFGCFVAILAMIALLFIGSIILASVSLFQTIKKANFKRALWLGIGGVGWSIAVFLIIKYAELLDDPESQEFWQYVIWSNIVGIVVSVFSVLFSISKIRKLNTRNVSRHKKPDNKIVENKKADISSKPGDLIVSAPPVKTEILPGNTPPEAKTLKWKSIAAIVISIVLLGSGTAYILLSKNHNSRQPENAFTIAPDPGSETNMNLKYSELDYGEAKRIADNALMQIYRKDYFDVNNTYPESCELYCDTILLEDINGDRLPDGLIHYFGENFGVYGNPGRMGWLILLNAGDNIKVVNPKIDYKFEFDRFSNDTLIGIVPVYDFDTHLPVSKNEVKYLFRSNDYVLISEKTIWNESAESENVSEGSNPKNDINIAANQPKKIQRDPRAKDVANVFWDVNYTLFCLKTDKPILPDSEGKYDIWYASHEEAYPHHKILTSEDLPSLTFYKFKDYETCKEWCDAKQVN